MVLIDPVPPAQRADWPDLVIKRTTLTTRSRELLYPVLAAMLPWDAQIVIRPLTVDTMVQAFATRVFLQERGGEWGPVAQPKVNIHESFAEFSSKLLRALPYRAHPRTYQEVIDSAPPEKRALYTRAVEELSDRPINSRNAKKRLVNNSFPKVEKGLKEGDPRAIRAFRPDAHVFFARYIAGCEKLIYRAIDTLFDSTVILKGLNADGMGQAIHSAWSALSAPVAVMLDAARFDQTVSKPVIRWKHWIYRHALRLTPSQKAELKLIERAQLKPRDRARLLDGEVKCASEGGLCSGHADTSLTACLTVCALFWTYCREAGIGRYRFVDNGDDCVLIVERDDLSKLDTLASWMEDRGFRYRVDGYAHNLEEIEFCQTHPVLTPAGTYRCVRTPQRALIKDCVICRPNLTRVEYDAIFASIGDGGVALAGDMPIYNVFYRKLQSISSRRTNIQAHLPFALRNLGDAAPRNDTVTQATRESFALATGISPGRQIEIEEYYASVEITGDVTRGVPQGWLPIE